MYKIYTSLIKEATRKKFKNPESFLAFKKKFCSQNKIPQPTNADLREIYDALVKSKKIKRNDILEKSMLARAVRTQSGVAVVAVLTKPSTCPGKCLYCPTEKGMPKSYLSNEPAVMRAIVNEFDPYLQTHNRLKVLELNGHATDKIELIVMGGTFSYFPKNYQQWFITECFRACNDYPRLLLSRKGSTLNRKRLNPSLEQKRNEKAKHRIIGLTLETRPDYIDEKEILNFRELGCTRVELGVQSIFDAVLKINRRGHDVAKTITSTQLLKDAGFKINYHMMPGLPGSSYKQDVKMFAELFSNQAFQPDMLKIYPTVMLKDSPLYKVWAPANKKNGSNISKNTKNNLIHYTSADAKCIIENFKPLTDKQFEKMILEIKNTAIPPYVRIARLVRDVPATSILGGPNVSNLRQIIAHRSQCPCIRCREVRADYNIKEKIILDRIDYAASDGQEIFLQYISPSSPSGPPARLADSKRAGEARRGAGGEGSKLFALLRLRIPSSACHPERSRDKKCLGEVEGSTSKLDSSTPLRYTRNDKLHDLLPILKNAALIREVHTYGKLAKIDMLTKKSLPARLSLARRAGPQHIGLGKKLLQEAERIAKEEYNLKKIVVISGVGVRDYYRHLGYRQQDSYMVNNI